MTVRAAAATLAAMLAGPLVAEDGDHAPFFLDAGWSRLSGAAAELTSTRGIHVGAGFISGDAGLIQDGFAGVDIDWRHAARNSNRIDSVSVCYTERDYGLIGDLYAGYGVGSSLHRMERHEPGVDSTDKAWRFTAELMIGYGFGDSVFLEGAYLYSGKVADIDTSGITISLGVWF
jgi:hypothetical protein